MVKKTREPMRFKRRKGQLEHGMPVKGYMKSASDEGNVGALKASKRPQGKTMRGKH